MDDLYPRKKIDPQKYNSGSINVEIDEILFIKKQYRNDYFRIRP
jgi:hypothetical protein